MSSLPQLALAQRLMNQMLGIIQGKSNATTIMRFKEILQLDKVDNTRDIDKPVSNRTAVAIRTGETTDSNPLNFQFNQNYAATSWTVTHNLNRHPQVSVISPSGEEIFGDVLHFNSNVLQITFSNPMTGTVYLV